MFHLGCARVLVDTAMTYSEKLRDPRWQKKRLEVMQRDEFACRDCGSKDKTLHVHHCHYEKGEPWETGSEFLLTLCEECHEIRGDFEADARKALGYIFTCLGRAEDNEPLKGFCVEICRASEELRKGDGFFPTVVDYNLICDLDERARRAESKLTP